MAKSVNASNNPAKGVKWDLSDLYISVNDTQIEKDKKKTTRRVNIFIEKYKGKINHKNITSKTLLSSIRDYEKIIEQQVKLGLFSSLIFSKDSHNQQNKKLNQEIREFSNDMSSKLLWFELEVIAIPSSKYTSLLKNKDLAVYKYYLDTVRKFKPHTLSEKEEIILTKKSQTSGVAFVRFFDEKTSYLRFPLKVNGKTKDLTLSELLPYLSHIPDRKMRIAASKVFTQVFKENQHFFTFVLNTLLLDKKVSDEIRDYKYPQEYTFLDYDVTPQIVNSMVNAVTTSTSIVEKYYKAKAKIQGLKILHEWDRYSPLFNNKVIKYSWDEARNTVLNAFSKADPSLKKHAYMFFDNNWIDAELSPYKRDGAFCSYGSPSTHPYVLCNFTGELGEVTTLAHELGHGVHAMLSHKHNPLLLTWPSTATAEIASVFAESLTFDLLLDDITDNKARLSFLANKIEGMIATIFRQTQFYLFESDLHNHRREKGELSSDDINNYYQTRLQQMFGKSLTLTDGHKYWWSYILHFYHYNFYVFTYAFGELLSLALYAKYKEEGQKFMDRYIEALKAGGSKSPVEITAIMGVNIEDPKFWNEGLTLLESYIEEFEQLAKAV